MLPNLLSSIDTAKKKWDVYKTQNKSALPVIMEKLRALWTCHSNALEGNTLTLGETIFFLREGLTSQGKPLKDYLEAKNHAEAIDYLYDVVAGHRPLTEGLIKELNALLLMGIEFSPARTEMGQNVSKKIHPGEYKKEPNHVLTLSGKIHHYTDPVQVPAEMEKLLKEYQHSHPLVTACNLHYGIVRIHPFDDCNGRVARLLMNLVLLQHNYPPAIIPSEKRKEYLTSLEKADAGVFDDFYKIVGESVLSTLEEILKS